MNNLKRGIQVDEIVIIRKQAVDDQWQADRRFRVTSGAGMSATTIGTALYGVWLADGEKMRFEGTDIDAKETEQFQAALDSQAPGLRAADPSASVVTDADRKWFASLDSMVKTQERIASLRTAIKALNELPRMESPLHENIAGLVLDLDKQLHALLKTAKEQWHAQHPPTSAERLAEFERGVVPGETYTLDDDPPVVAPAPEPQDAPELTDAERRFLANLAKSPRNLYDDPLPTGNGTMVSVLISKGYVQTLGIMQHQKTLYATDAGKAALQVGATSVAPKAVKLTDAQAKALRVLAPGNALYISNKTDAWAISTGAFKSLEKVGLAKRNRDAFYAIITEAGKQALAAHDNPQEKKTLKTSGEFTLSEARAELLRLCKTDDENGDTGIAATTVSHFKPSALASTKWLTKHNLVKWSNGRLVATAYGEEVLSLHDVDKEGE